MEITHMDYFLKCLWRVGSLNFREFHFHDVREYGQDEEGPGPMKNEHLGGIGGK
jgi:hypothetical protein